MILSHHTPHHVRILQRSKTCLHTLAERKHAYAQAEIFTCMQAYYKHFMLLRIRTEHDTLGLHQKLTEIQESRYSTYRAWRTQLPNQSTDFVAARRRPPCQPFGAREFFKHALQV